MYPTKQDSHADWSVWDQPWRSSSGISTGVESRAATQTTSVSQRLDVDQKKGNALAGTEARWSIELL